MNDTTLAMVKLAVVFAILMIAIHRKMKLSMSTAIASLAGIVIFRLGIKQIGGVLLQTATSWETISMLLIFYLIIFLQRMLEERDHMGKAQKNLDNLFHNRRINATVAPMLIGLLPSPAAASICGDIVDDAAGDSLNSEDKAFVTSFYRHIPESFLPTYAEIVMMSELAGVSLSSFTLGMIIPVAVMYLIGYAGWVRKIPRRREGDETCIKTNKGRELLALIYHLWTLFAIILAVMIFKIDVLLAIAAVIVVDLFIDHFRLNQIPRLAIRALDPELLISTWFIFLFKNILVEAGVIAALPQFFTAFPMPAYLIFAFIFFFGSLTAGSTAMVAMCTSVAFHAVCGPKMPLMVLLKTFAWAAMELSPTHICLMIAADYFHISLGSLIRKTIIPILILCTFTVLYYLVLVQMI